MKENENPDQKMYYRMLGGTGLQVSVLSFGFWATYGVKEGLTNEEGILRLKSACHLPVKKV
ncbi:MAG: hypothetical protein Ct9H300mP28_20120 [Pseudomonadota bacterium]|nr:MAG: hypothetical protein Ct9H300mP28_20120 [Pseudomonadota bacterium]